MKERPILLSGLMVRAILEGRKTQTRRVWKKQPYRCSSPTPRFSDTEIGDLFICPDLFPTEPGPVGAVITECIGTGSYHCMGSQSFIEKHGPKAHGVPGDRLWVREVHWRWGKWVRNGLTKSGRTKWKFSPVGTGLRYMENRPKATAKRDGECGWVYRHSRFMFRAHSRITLEITDVRVQRVQEISEEDAKAEGATVFDGERLIYNDKAYIPAFASLWDFINGKTHPWTNNDWVWALTFRRAK